MKGLVLGLGNDILTDDGVGLIVTRRLKDRFKDTDQIDFVETNEMGLALLDFLEGYNWAVIVDSVITGKHEPGTLHTFDRTTFDNPRACNPHHMGLDEILEMADKMNLTMPNVLYVTAIEVKDPFSFGEKLSPEVEKALPDVVSKIEKMIKNNCLKLK